MSSPLEDRVREALSLGYYNDSLVYEYFVDNIMGIIEEVVNGR